MSNFVLFLADSEYGELGPKGYGLEEDLDTSDSEGESELSGEPMKLSPSFPSQGGGAPGLRHDVLPVCDSHGQ